MIKSRSERRGRAVAVGVASFHSKYIYITRVFAGAHDLDSAHELDLNKLCMIPRRLANR